MQKPCTPTALQGTEELSWGPGAPHSWPGSLSHAGDSVGRSWLCCESWVTLGRPPSPVSLSFRTNNGITIPARSQKAGGSQ